MRCSNVRGSSPWNGRLAGQHLVQDDAERVDVDAGVDVVGFGDLLGRHELGRAHQHAAPGPLVAAVLHELRDAEVEHLHVVDHVVAFGQEHVVALEVAVDDARRVRGLQRRGDLAPRSWRRAADRQRAEAVHLLGQERSLEVLEDDVRDPALAIVLVEEAHVGRLDDVGVAERAGGARLVQEALDHRAVGRQLGVEHLHRDPAA
jgi:hypothetical protein